MQRIMIIGQPGSGKSTLAQQMGERLQLPVRHIDLIHWQPGWVEREGPEKDRLCQQVHQSDQWIFEGGRSSTWAERLERADTLIWLDFPLYLRAWRVVKRTIKHYGKSRPDLPDNCPERFNWEFTSYIWDSRKSSRLKMFDAYRCAPVGKRKYRFTNRQEVEIYIATLDVGKLY